MSKISEKLEPLAKTVTLHTTELKRAYEAESRVLQLEEAEKPLTAKVQALEEKVKTLADHSDNLENRGR